MRPSFSYAQAILSVCGCRACLGSRHKLIQGAQSTARRTVKHGPPTTFIFSALFTVAAAADVRLKADRRQELDQAIDHVERSLQSPDTSDPPQISEGGTDSHQPHTTVVRSGYVEEMGPEEREIQAVIDSVPWRLPHPILPQEDKYTFINAVLSYLDPLKPDLPQLWSRNLGLHRGSLFTSGKEKAAKVERWTPKKLRTLEFSLAKLVAELSLGALALREDNEGRRERERELTLVLDAMSENLNKIMDRQPWDVDDLVPPPYPRYWPNPSRSWDDDFELKESINAVMDKLAKGEIQLTEALEHISHNLLVAPQPPGNQTYSILINRLSRAQCFNLADKALTSMLETHRRPDERCVASVFDHFRRAGDADSFERFRHKARGYFGSFISPYWEREFEEHSPLTVARHGRPAMGLRPTGPLYVSLIRGQLRFDRLRDAMRNFYQIENTPIELPMPVFAILMRRLVQRKRGIHAKRVWNKLMAQLDNRTEMLSKLDQTSCQEAFSHAQTMFKTTQNEPELRKLRSLRKRLGVEVYIPLARALSDQPRNLEDLMQERRNLEEQVEHSRLRVRELDMKALALWFIFRSGHALNAIREAYLRLGEQYDYVHWAVSRTASGQDVWMPPDWNEAFGIRRAGHWKFRFPFANEAVEAIQIVEPDQVK